MGSSEVAGMSRDTEGTGLDRDSPLPFHGVIPVLELRAVMRDVQHK